ncbi:MAG: glycosyltransferase [Chloroflexota bacterium]
MPKCSVNIPYYGQGRYLRAVLGSLQTQSALEQLEVTVIDDQSPEQAEHFVPQDASVEVIRNSENMGMVKNWNRCLTHGNHEYVHVMHYDDLLDSRFYATVLSEFEQSKTLGLVYTDTQRVYSKKLSASYWISRLAPRPSLLNAAPVHYLAGDEAVRQAIRGIRCSSVVIRREAVQELGLFREDLPYSPDEEYWARIAARWSIAHIPMPLAIFRYHDANHEVSTWLQSDFWDRLEATRHARLAHLSHPTEQDRAAQAASLARIGTFVALVLLARGYREQAEHYLECAAQIYEPIRVEKSFRQATEWLSQSHWGRLKAQFMSPF